MTIETRIARRHVLKAPIGGASGAVTATLLAGRQASVGLPAETTVRTLHIASVQFNGFSTR